MWNFSSNCSSSIPLSKIQREGTRLVFTSHRSVTIRYLMTPESLMRVLTPYEVIIATESLSWIAGAVCSTGFWQAAKTQEIMTPITMKYLILYIIIYIEDVASPEENTTIWADYCIFHFLNQSSLKVNPMFRRKIFSLISPVAEFFTHWPLIFNCERLL